MPLTGRKVSEMTHALITAREAPSVMPVIVRQAGARAEEKFAEFFAASIRNLNTRTAYLRAVQNHSPAPRRRLYRNAFPRAIGPDRQTEFGRY
jgi:hypothetical protein